MDGQPLYKLGDPLSPDEEAAYKSALSRLQGNILKSHGRDAAMHVFLKFRDGKVNEVKQFLSEFALKVTSAFEQREQARRDPHGSELFTALYLSAEGYRYLGKEQGKFSDEFWGGMAKRAEKLGDPEINQFQNVHVMVLFAHDNQDVLDEQVRSLTQQTNGFADIVAKEIGTTKKNPAGQVTEHFGYVDGISQPLFYQCDVGSVTTAKWNPGAGPKLVLVRDPCSESDEDCGTYLVFRKLEQNVKGFNDQIRALADKVAHGDQDRASAMVVGRYKTGAPAISPGQTGGQINDFTYQGDEQGKRCPFFAHIRKTNPRGQTGNADDEKKHRIVRRGITYGNDGDAAVGLLFQCCQADIASQFEFLQSQWADNDKFPNPDPASGKDPIIGQSGDGKFGPLEFPNSSPNPGTTPFSFNGFVTMKGGEYFFAPSISFLRGLK